MTTPKTTADELARKCLKELENLEIDFDGDETHEQFNEREIDIILSTIPLAEYHEVALKARQLQASGWSDTKIADLTTALANLKQKGIEL